MRLHLFDNRQLNFVELNSTGTNNQYIKCSPESKYIDSVVFNLFAECYEHANKMYEYYGPTKYNARWIVPLRNQLMTHLAKFEKVNSLNGFQDFINQKVLGKEFLMSLVHLDKNWTSRWVIYHEKLIRINEDLLEIVDFCIDNDRILWVVGF